jgi:hypothetical protein
MINDGVKRIEQIMEERAADPAMQNIPGGKTGLVKRTLKSIGSGANATIIEEFEFDTALSKEHLAVLEQCEKEMAASSRETRVRATAASSSSIIPCLGQRILKPWRSRR